MTWPPLVNGKCILDSPVSPETHAREATPEDMPRLMEMGRAALQSAPLKMSFSEPWLRRTMAGLMTSRSGLVSVLERSGQAAGMLMATTYDSPLSPVLMAQEIALWVEPDHRGRGLAPLLEHYHAWAKRQGVAHIGLCTFHDPRTTRVFERLGYLPVETHYVAKV